MCFEEKWLQNQLRAEKNESRSLLMVNIKGHQRGGVCIVLFLDISIKALSFVHFLKNGSLEMGNEIIFAFAQK